MLHPSSLSAEVRLVFGGGDGGGYGLVVVRSVAVVVVVVGRHCHTMYYNYNQ